VLRAPPATNFVRVRFTEGRRSSKEQIRTTTIHQNPSPNFASTCEVEDLKTKEYRERRRQHRPASPVAGSYRLAVARPDADPDLRIVSP